MVGRKAVGPYLNAEMVNHSARVDVCQGLKCQPVPLLLVNPCGQRLLPVAPYFTPN